MLLAQPLIIKRVGDVVTPARKCQAVPPCARSGRAMRPHHSAAKTPYAWLWEDKNLADANLLLHVAGEPAGAAPLAALRVHRAVLAAHSEHFKTKVLGWADSDLQRAADFQPSIAVAHFIEAGSLPAGLTAHQLAQVCNEAKAREKLQCAETCSQAIVALVLEEAGKAQPVLPCLEETFDSQAECDAARLVVRCMYKEDLAESFKDALTLARMCRIAKRWVSSSIITSCLQRLIDLPPSQLPAEQLMLVLQTLPGNCALLPEHKKWQDRVHSLEGELNALPIPLHLYGEHVGWQEHARSLIVGQFGDVHAVITSAQLRTAFQQLPFAAVQQWAGSNALTVDSENSVVELISLWMAGSGGQACSKEQKQQLSCLVRVQHLSPAYALGRLPKLDWFDIPGASTARVAACCGFGMTEVLDTNKAPPAWSAAPRKQLDPDEVLRRTTIRWCVTRQQLVDLLASKDLTAEIASVPMYLAGVGWRVCVDLQRTRQDELNIALHQRCDLQGQEHASGLDGPGLSLSCCGQLVAYAECDGHSLGAPLEHGAPINYCIACGRPERPGEHWAFAWVLDEWGRSSSGDKALKMAAEGRTPMRHITSALQVLHKAQPTVVAIWTLKRP